jgi:transcriptional regulator with AAA-type ATPase domain
MSALAQGRAGTRRAGAAWREPEEVACLRRWRGPVLLVHEDAALRERVALRIHSMRPSRSGVFLRVDCREFSQAGARLTPPLDEMWSDLHGTLFVDGLECLPLTLQRQLLAWMDRQSEQAGSPACPGPRLVAGVQAKRDRIGRDFPVLPELLDTLDKFQVNLEPELRS